MLAIYWRNCGRIGVITGAGTVSPAGDLVFKMLADLSKPHRAQPRDESSWLVKKAVKL